MGPIETFHGWGGGEDDLQLHLDHIRIKDVDLPYYRIAQVAVADAEPDSLVDLPRLIIRLGDGEEFVVPLPADQAERARSLIQVPDARREALLQGGLPHASQPPPDRSIQPGPPVAGAGWNPPPEPHGHREPQSGLLRRLVRPGFLPGVAEWAFAGILMLVAVSALGFLVLSHSAPRSVPAANLTPGPSSSPRAERVLPAERHVRPSHAAPTPGRTKHRVHRTQQRPAPASPAATTAPQAAPAPPPPAPVAAPPKPKPSPKPSPKPTTPPSPSPVPSISTSGPGPSPSISIG